MKHKWIFILPALWVGGIEQALVTLLRALEGEGELTCLILTDHRELAHRLPESCRLIRVDRESYPFARLHQLTETPSAPSRIHRLFAWTLPGLRWMEGRLFARQVRRTLAGEVFDRAVIYSDAVAEIALRSVPAKAFFLVYHQGLPRKISGDRLAWKRCREIIAVSEPLAESLRRFRPKYAGKIRAIPNLTDRSWITDRSLEFDPGFSPEKFHIVSVGRLHRDKGMDLAVDAAKLLKERKIPIHWWIVGGGPEEKTLEDQIRKLGLSDTVTLTGMRENPYPYMARADLYVQPSRQEGYGLTIAEAMALGKPVLATDTAGARAQLPEDCLCQISAQEIARAAQDRLLRKPEMPARDWESETEARLGQWKALLKQE